MILQGGVQREQHTHPAIPHCRVVFSSSLCSLKSDDTLLGSRFVPVRFRSQVETCIQAKKKKRMVYLEGPGMQRFVLSLGFILKFCRKRYITVWGKGEGREKGKNVRHASKNPQEKYSQSPATCCFVTVCSVLMEVESLKTLVFGLCCFPAPGSAVV